MKFEIFGYNQEIAFNKYNLDMIDLAILRWFHDFKVTDKMKKVTEAGQDYYQIKYAALNNDYPIFKLNGGERVYRRLLAMVTKKILTAFRNNDGNYYNFDENYQELLWTAKAKHTAVINEGLDQFLQE